MKKLIVPLFLALLFSLNTISAQNTLYVSLSGSNTAPYNTWANAATSIQVAVDAATAGDIIKVGPGTYILTTNISIAKGITLKSENGSSSTIISGNDVTRCMEINHFNAVVDGFTISHGRNISGYGGGVQCTVGIIKNCIVENNIARDGGGVALENMGNVINCIIRNNSAEWGGGVRCFGGIVQGCLITGNTATPHGGGINIWSGGLIENCTITNNTATDGAGIRLWNNGVIQNSIIYNNTGSSNYIIDSGAGNYVSYSCTTPLCAGTGNIAADPKFVNSAGDFHLLSTSPAIDAGENSSWMNSAKDLDGNDRLFNSNVDIGAYEYKSVTIGGPTPIVSWPVGNPTEYTNPPTLYWYLGTYVTGITYEIQCVAASEPWPAENVFSTSSTMSFTLPSALNGGVKYAWRVRSTNGSTKSNWSTTAFFTMVANTNSGPVIPITSWPKGNPTQYTNPPTLYWYLGTAATGLTYEIQCVEASASWPADNVYATSSTFSFTLPYTLTAGVQYAWRVRSTNGVTKSSWSSTELFTMVANSTSGPVVPITSWPVGNPTEYNNPPTLNWYIGVYAPGLTYEIQCVPAADPWPADNVFATSSSLSFIMPYSLSSGVQYAWRVRSTDGVTKSNWSTAELFTMVGNTNSGPVVPIASWPVGNPTEYTNPPTLHWYLGVYATGLTYEIQCVEASAPWPADNVFATSSGLSFTMPSGLTAGVQYAWRVRSTNGTSKSAWSSTEFFTMVGSNSSGPVVPIASWPVGNPTEYTNPPTLNWYLGTSTTGLTYELQCVVASDPWPADDVFSTSTSMSFTMPSALINGVQYAWRVRSTDGTTKSSWSTTALFTMVSNNALVQPLTGSPSNSVMINARTAQLHWYLPTATSANSAYEIEIADNPEFQKAKVMSSPKSNIQVNGLEGGKKYFWKVRSTDGIGKSSIYSSIGQFEVNKNITAIEDQKEIPNAFQLSQNYPNPFNPTTVIEYNIPVEGFYTLEVFNILGEKVSTLINGVVSRGTYKVTFNGKDFSSGVYFYKLTGSNVNLIRKMLLIK